MWINRRVCFSEPLPYGNFRTSIRGWGSLITQFTRVKQIFELQFKGAGLQQRQEGVEKDHISEED